MGNLQDKLKGVKKVAETLDLIFVPTSLLRYAHKYAKKRNMRSEPKTVAYGAMGFLELVRLGAYYMAGTLGYNIYRLIDSMIK